METIVSQIRVLRAIAHVNPVGRDLERADCFSNCMCEFQQIPDFLQPVLFLNTLKDTIERSNSPKCIQRITFRAKVSLYLLNYIKWEIRFV